MRIPFGTRWQGRLSALLAALLLTVGAALAQVDNVYVYGTVKDYISAKKMDGVVVSVFKNGAKLTETITNASGKYEFNLDYGADYKITYTKAGIVSKNITIDTRNIPEEERVGGHGMNIEMTLFQELPGIDFTVLNQPIGKAKFDPTTSEVTWDLQYTEQIRSEIARLMKEYEDKKRREAGAEAEFAKLMQAGEAAMGAADYKKAVDSFTAALGIKAGDPVATAKLSDARMRLDELEGQKKRDEQYAALIKEADALFGKKDYENAKVKYNAALDVKEQEAYPKQKVKEIDTLLAELAKKAEEERKAKELQAKYDAAIKAGDAAFKAGKFAEAKTPYTEAAGLKPDEKYPKDQLTAIDAKLAELAAKAEEERKRKELEAQYTALITAADAAFKAANYDQAKGKYSEAAGLKPDEKYPKDQLAAIEAKLAELAKKAEEERLARELQAKYDAAIAAADASFKGADYEGARGKYNEALGLKPAEKYPKDQLAAIDKKLAELAAKAEEERKQRELQEKYQAAIAAADAAFQGDSFDEARTKYTEALGLKPAEKYPKDQLVAIDKRIAELAAKAEEERKRKELDARFNEVVALADALFGKKEYDQAKAKYIEAANLKPEERHPKERIVEIDGILAELARKAEEERKRQELEARYAELIGRADKAYSAEQWPAALNDYKDALNLKPTEAHPQARIADIEQRLDAAAREKAEQERLAREKADLDARYQGFLAKADKAFSLSKYDDARTAYTDALGVKPDEAYPKDKLAEIDRILADLAAKDEAARLAAEKAARDKAAADAAAADEARRKAETEALERRYRELIAAADLAFDGEQFERAREKYTEALTVKPDEQYPKDRLARIESELAARAAALSEAERLAAEQRRAEEERRRREAEAAEAARLAAEAERMKGESDRLLEERYRKTITEADLAFGAKSWPEARGLYAQALDIKPNEAYPADRIAEIDRLVAEEEARRRAAELAAQRVVKEEPPPPPKRSSTTIDMRKEQEAEQFMREARLREEAEKYERIKKLRRDLTDEELAERDAAATRRQEGVTYKQRIEENDQQLYQGSEEQRKAYAEQLRAYQASLAEAERARQERSAMARGGAQAATDATREQQADASRQRAEDHAGQVAAQRTAVEQWQARQEQNARLGLDRNQRAREEVVAQAERQVALQERGAEVARGLRDNVQETKDVQARVGQQLSQRATDQRLAAQEQLANTPLNKPKDFADYNRSKLATEYPPGVTEESYTEGNKVIIRRVVVSGNKADEYSKVIAKWGTFYFKNGQSITEMIWANETESE
ncbi:MAG: hypothetical protein IT228_07030 [Flavobacteriales bacterium]|nr:hypothetical protein [Flavobacteriales bacterium]MCC6577080.1 hypothetical protein [Flavobacteriales bacterium]NUQ16237.1 hypothetical protein [Flavobacteriales bacterium]